MSLSAERLLDGPIIHPHMDQRMGSNINGPSLIRVPDWVASPLGKYYLYFAHHKGTYIRMAYADSVVGPWTIYSPGVLDVKDSLFESVDPLPSENSEKADWAKKLQGDDNYAHVASPHVLVDHQNQIIRMYYHGMLKNCDQQTRIAHSTDGLTFTAKEPLLGPPYFRVFEYQDYIYALSWGGALWRSANWEGPFEPGPRVIPDQPKPDNHHGFRHGEFYLYNKTLYVFYSRIGDCPERIIYLTVDLQSDWHHWKANGPYELLAPERQWEGVDCALVSSKVGAAETRVNQLRDPCIFQDTDGQHYLLYSGAGESAIGLATLKGFASNTN